MWQVLQVQLLAVMICRSISNSERVKSTWTEVIYLWKEILREMNLIRPSVRPSVRMCIFKHERDAFIFLKYLIEIRNYDHLLKARSNEKFLRYRRIAMRLYWNWKKNFNQVKEFNKMFTSIRLVNRIENFYLELIAK